MRDSKSKVEYTIEYFNNDEQEVFKYCFDKTDQEKCSIIIEIIKNFETKYQGEVGSLKKTGVTFAPQGWIDGIDAIKKLKIERDYLKEKLILSSEIENVDSQVEQPDDKKIEFNYVFEGNGNRVIVNGEEIFDFTTNQAEVISILYDNYNNKNMFIKDNEIGDSLNKENFDMYQTFNDRNIDFKRKYIETDNRRGWRLRKYKKIKTT